MKKGYVYLVGAGPGDPTLATLRAVECLKAADVVLYDALVHPDLLLHCRPDVTTIFVGKRAGRVSERQEMINHKMIEAAKQNKIVVRLKGGDPYLFGRGSEEAQVLFEAKVPFEVVPGVPSTVAASAYAGISLSHRDYASSIAYITASESPEKDKSAHDWSKLATATQTLVIFMGMRKLESLMRLLISHGRHADTPAAVVHWASLPTQRVVTGTVSTIAKLAQDAGLGLPSLVIVGDVVKLRDILSWYEKKPLFGKRVLVTRPAEQAVAVAAKLRERGAEPVLIPTIRIAPPRNPQALTKALKAIGTYDWIIFTSQNTVTTVFAELEALNLDARAFGPLKIAAIGPATAEALKERNLQADVVPDVYQAEGLVSALRAQASVKGKRVLLPRAAKARDVIPEELTREGAHIDVVEAYQTLAVSSEEQHKLKDSFKNKKIDIVLLTSSSTVTNLVNTLHEEPELLTRPIFASIGPITTETATKLGLRVAVTAKDYTIDGLLDALEAAIEDGLALR